MARSTAETLAAGMSEEKGRANRRKNKKVKNVMNIFLISFYTFLLGKRRIVIFFLISELQQQLVFALEEAKSFTIKCHSCGQKMTENGHPF